MMKSKWCLWRPQHLHNMCTPDGSTSITQSAARTFCSVARAGHGGDRGRTNGRCVEGTKGEAHCRQLPIGTGVVGEGRVGDCMRVVEPLRDLRQRMPADVNAHRGAAPSENYQKPQLPPNVGSGNHEGDCRTSVNGRYSTTAGMRGLQRAAVQSHGLPKGTACELRTSMH